MAGLFDESKPISSPGAAEKAKLADSDALSGTADQQSSLDARISDMLAGTVSPCIKDLVLHCSEQCP